MKTRGTIIQKASRPLGGLRLAFAFIFILSAVLSAVLIKTNEVSADPSGVSITGNITSTSPTYSPDNRSDAGGTITTMTLSVIQQNSKWKAYVGNISGVLTLDDSNSNTIYQWAMSAADITGEIYASRANSFDWSVVNCSNVTVIETEDSALGFSGTEVDTINKTFNESTHQAIVVAGRTIAQNTCRSTATYVNDTKQNQATASFQEVLFKSGSDQIYVSKINQGSSSFNNASIVDFQLLLADDVTVTATTYYFFAEIG